jgi:hypothetical protein
MELQWLLVVLALVAAGGYVGRQTYRTWFGRGKGCAGGCGCDRVARAGQQEQAGSLQQLSLRVRGSGSGPR